MAQRGLLLVGHGSREPEGNEQFLRVAERIRVALERPELEAWTVQPCFIELASPEVPEGIDRLVGRGCREIVAVPVTLFAAGHVKEEIPGHLAEAAGRHPDVVFRYGGPVGVEPAVIPVLQELLARGRLVDAAPEETSGTGTGSSDEPGEEAAAGPRRVLLVGRGASDPEANSDFYKLSRLLWEQLRATGTPFSVDRVEVCFAGITEPDLEGGLARSVEGGARQVHVLPYFLFTGVLMQRIVRRVGAWAEARPDVKFFLAGTRGIGEHPVLVDVILRRVREAARGPVFTPAS